MISNTTKRKTIASKHRECVSEAQKAIGLMFSRRIKDFGLVFRFSSQKIRSLHMFFVFYAIDVLFLSKDFRIVEIKRNLLPFTFYIPSKPSQYIIELPKGDADGCDIGDKIKFK